MKCYNHPKKEAAGICTDCGKAICKECSDIVSGKMLCFKCMKKALEEGVSKKRGKAKGGKRGRHLTGNWNLFDVVCILLMLGGISGLLFFPAYLSSASGSLGFFVGIVGLGSTVTKLVGGWKSYKRDKGGVGLVFIGLGLEFVGIFLAVLTTYAMLESFGQGYTYNLLPSALFSAIFPSILLIYFLRSYKNEFPDIK